MNLKSTPNLLINGLLNFLVWSRKSVVYSDFSTYAKKLANDDMRGICCLYTTDMVILVLLMSYHKNSKGGKITEGDISQIQNKARSIGKNLDKLDDQKLHNYISKAKKDEDKLVFTDS